jgi:hypothetical protein
MRKLSRPVSPKAKYFTGCKSCDSMIFRLWDGELHHMVVEDGKVVGYYVGTRWCYGKDDDE